MRKWLEIGAAALFAAFVVLIVRAALERSISGPAEARALTDDSAADAHDAMPPSGVR